MMAHHGPSGQQQTWPYSSQIDPLNNPDLFGDLEAASNHILDQSETNILMHFFQDPDGDGLALPNLDMAPPSSGMLAGGGNSLDMTGMGTVNPASTLGGARSASYGTHAHNIPGHGVGDAGRWPGDAKGAPASDDVFNAASDLMNMSSTTGQEQSHMSGLSGFAATNSLWGRIGPNNPVPSMHDNLQSPLTSSGRQSVTSYSTPTSHSHNSSLTQQQLERMFSQQPFTQQVQPQPDHGMDRATRHHSLQLGMDLHLLPQRNVHAPAHSAYPLGQNLNAQNSFQFGSDHNFSMHGYRGNSTHQDNGKEFNLLNLPLVEQASQQRYTHSQSYSPATHAHFAGPRHSMPGVTPDLSRSTSSPIILGGLPYESPTTITTMQGNNDGFAAQMPVRERLGMMEGQNSPEALAATPLKRRKSQAEPEDDESYDPTRDPSGATRKRKLRADGEWMENANDDDWPAPLSGDRILSNKRPKSTTVPYQPSHHSVDSSSPPPESSSTGRKKKEGKQRQNLSTQQKRENHIMSEQKRRNLIKNGYGDLNYLVPALNGGKSGLSKAEILKETVAFLESVVHANAKAESALKHPENVYKLMAAAKPRNTAPDILDEDGEDFGGDDGTGVDDFD